jgi:hypothetical protein
VIKAMRMDCNLSRKASPYHTDRPALSRNPLPDPVPIADFHIFLHRLLDSNSLAYYRVAASRRKRLFLARKRAR